MEQLNQLLENEAFMEKVTSAGSVEEIAAIFAENGVELSTEEIKGMIQEVISGKTAGGELDETALEGVAGGRIIGAVIIGKIVEKIKNRINNPRSPGIWPGKRPSIWDRIR